MKLISKALKIAYVKGVTQFYRLTTCTFIREWNEEPSCLYFQPQCIIALWPVLISRPTEGRRLSRLGWMVTYRGVPARR